MTNIIEYKMKPVNKNSMLYWYPKLKELNILTPKTEFVKLKYDRDSKYECPFFFDEEEMDKAIEKVGGYPIFVRTDHASNKHDMAIASYIPNKKSLKKHIHEVILFNDMNMLPFRCLVVRNWLDLDYKFLAFNSTKIAKELRLFINRGKVQCYHYYWPMEAIEPKEKTFDNSLFIEDGEEEIYISNPNKVELPDNWKELLNQTKEETLSEIGKIIPLVKKVAEVFPEYWSVDFARTVTGEWYCIDMALGEYSWHSGNCTERVEK